eukprot:snap_masked-scaffold_6-processed-gene-3.39-mRNA-1 protein AED:1.00 eAED:1.00 QI:0/0/0/0/1/1/2/0/70
MNLQLRTSVMLYCDESVPFYLRHYSNSFCFLGLLQTDSDFSQFQPCFTHECIKGTSRQLHVSKEYLRNPP